MKFRIVEKDPTKVRTMLLIAGVFEDDFPAGTAADINDATAGALARQARVEDFGGKVGQTLVFFADGKVNTTQVLFFGLGKRSAFNLDVLRKALTAAYRKARAMNAEEATMAALPLDGTGVTPYAWGQAVAEYAHLVDYVINHYKTARAGHKKESHLHDLNVLCSRECSSEVREGLAAGRAIGEAVNLARDLGNLPAGRLTPMALAREAAKVAAASGGSITIRTLRRPHLRKLGAHALLAVAQGSVQEPVLVELTYTPASGATDDVLAFVGKSVTFDSGGLNLKNAEGMRTMKRDMSGGAAVLAAIKAVAALKLPLSVRAYMAATENLPDGKSYKPGDVLDTLAGLTVEVDNTDAEGRLTLADAIEYAKRRGATRIVDVATLTGAIRQFGGDVGAGAFGNKPEFTAAIVAAARSAGERVGELPMWEEFRAANHSDMADLKNSGGDPGSVTAAWFLREFAGEDIPWVHLDIAGPSYRSRELGADPKGCTGFSVRTLVELARALSRK